MLSKQRRHRHFYCVTAFVFAGIAPQAQAFEIRDLLPPAIFIQTGFAEDNTRSYVLGVRWDWTWHGHFSFGEVTGFHEVSFGRWITGDSKSATWATQLGLTPVARLHPAIASQWFGEIGIGANLIVPIYRSHEKTFSTIFNFGDHIAIGRQFGAQRHQELSLRVQHFSNAGIDKPNPGENFVQLRYSHCF